MTRRRYELILPDLGFDDRPIFGDPKPGDVQRSVVDASKAKRVLGWEAWTALPEGIAKTVAWYRSQL